MSALLHVKKKLPPSRKNSVYIPDYYILSSMATSLTRGKTDTLIVYLLSWYYCLFNTHYSSKQKYLGITSYRYLAQPVTSFISYS